MVIPFHEPAMEDTIGFPAFLNVERGPDRFKLSPLHAVFYGLGVVSLTAMKANSLSRNAGEDALSFLTDASTFILGGRGREALREEGFRRGWHTHVRDLTGDPEAGLRAAAEGIAFIPGSEHPIGKMAVEYYTYRGVDRDQRMPVSVVAASFTMEGHPEYRSAYVRLSARSAEDGRDVYHMSAAAGMITHHDIPVPDADSTFGQLAAAGSKLAAFPVVHQAGQ